MDYLCITCPETSWMFFKKKWFYHPALPQSVCREIPAGNVSEFRRQQARFSLSFPSQWLFPPLPSTILGNFNLKDSWVTHGARGCGDSDILWSPGHIPWWHPGEAGGSCTALGSPAWSSTNPNTARTPI